MYYQLTSSTTAPAGSRNRTEASEVICQIRERGREGESNQRVYTILLYCQFYLTIQSILFYYMQLYFIIQSIVCTRLLQMCVSFVKYRSLLQGSFMGKTYILYFLQNIKKTRFEGERERGREGERETHETSQATFLSCFSSSGRNIHKSVHSKIEYVKRL